MNGGGVHVVVRRRKGLTTDDAPRRRSVGVSGWAMFDTEDGSTGTDEYGGNLIDGAETMNTSGTSHRQQSCAAARRGKGPKADDLPRRRLVGGSAGRRWRRRAPVCAVARTDATVVIMSILRMRAVLDM